MLSEKAMEKKREYNRNYRIANKEKVNAYQRKYAREHPEQILKFQETYWKKKIFERELNKNETENI